MANVFSFPTFPPSPDYTVVSYDILKSAATGNAINPYGPWTTFQSGITSNLNIVDPTGTDWDLYRVVPHINITASNTNVQLDASRPFQASTPLYDCQISALLQIFRQSYLNDMGTPSTDSTIPTESTGAGAAPFITDTAVSRFYLSFIPNTEPVKFRESEIVVYLGTSPSTAVPLTAYTDYYPNGEGGYIDFKVTPPASDYLKVEFKAYRFTDTQLRNYLVNSVSQLGLYGITNQNYNVSASWNYYYLTNPLPDRDVGQILCAIAAKQVMAGQVLTMAQSAEEWKIGSTQFTSDPSRSIQGAVQFQAALDTQIKAMANNYIINTRTYFSRGEFDSFFDNSGIMYPPFSVYNVFNYMSWWL